MQEYHRLLRKVYSSGTDVPNRTGIDTRTIFGTQMRFDLKQGFPLLTTKHTSFKLIATELLWFLKGNPDVSYLHEHNNHIWDEWAKEDGSFGPIYGSQWRSWTASVEPHDWGGVEKVTIDQIANVIKRLKTDPHGRRHIVSAWNVADVESGEMALPPCHVLFQFFTLPLNWMERVRAEIGKPRGFGLWDCADQAKEVLFAASVERDGVDMQARLDELGVPKYGLSCQLYQRSADFFLGVPFNIASYALLTHMIAHLTNMVPWEFVWTGGDTHIYHNHFDQVRELLGRAPELHPLPKLFISRPVESIDDFELGSFNLQGYQAYPAIKAPIAV